MLPHKKINILVVDDELSIRESLSGWLKRGGYLVETAADGLTALAKNRENHYDIMLIDVKMPEMDGLTLLKKIKETEVETAILMMTAYGDIHDAVEAIKQGAYDYLLKPFEFDELKTSIDRALLKQSEEKLIRKLDYQKISRNYGLTKKETEIIKIILSNGASNADISESLTISKNTVKVHLRNIFRKIGVESKTALTTLLISGESK